MRERLGPAQISHGDVHRRNPCIGRTMHGLRSEPEQAAGQRARHGPLSKAGAIAAALLACVAMAASYVGFDRHERRAATADALAADDACVRGKVDAAARDAVARAAHSHQRRSSPPRSAVRRRAALALLQAGKPRPLVHVA